MNEYETVTEATEAAAKSGYTNSFKVENGRLRCLETNEQFEPSEVTIVNHHRFEGPSSEDDMSIVYLIECNDRAKGTIIDAFGTYSDPDLAAFLQNVPIHEH